MSFLRHGQIYHPINEAGRSHVPARPSHRLMSLQPGIPRQVALPQSPPPLARLKSMLNFRVEHVNQHPNRGGEFSTG